MSLNLLVNEFEKKLTVFRTESDVQFWMQENNLTPSISNYKNVVAEGNKYIKKTVDEIIKDIEIDLLLGIIDFKLSSEHIEKNLFAETALGVGLASSICLLFPFAIIPTLAISSLVGILGVNFSLNKKVCQILIDNSKKVAQNISEQISSLLHELFPPNPIYNNSYVEKKIALDCDEIFNSIVSNTIVEATILSTEQLQLKAFLENRKIKYLVHFTNSKNIDSIKKHGILSVYELKQHGISFNNNDANRYDRMLDYISLSVTQPNKYVLRKFKENGTLNEASLIYIDASILYEEISTPRVYCDRNAAKGSCQKGSSISDFENMFSNNKEYDRYEHYRDDNEPTDTQAEILFNKKVDVKYIKRIVKL